MTDEEIIAAIETWKSQDGEVTLRQYAMEITLLIDNIRAALEARRRPS